MSAINKMFDDLYGRDAALAASDRYYRRRWFLSWRLFVFVLFVLGMACGWYGWQRLAPKTERTRPHYRPVATPTPIVVTVALPDDAGLMTAPPTQATTVHLLQPVEPLPQSDTASDDLLAASLTYVPAKEKVEEAAIKPSDIIQAVVIVPPDWPNASSTPIKKTKPTQEEEPWLAMLAKQEVVLAPDDWPNLPAGDQKDMPLKKEKELNKSSVQKPTRQVMPAPAIEVASESPRSPGGKQPKAGKAEPQGAAGRDAIKQVSSQQEAEHRYALAMAPGQTAAQREANLRQCLVLQPMHVAARGLLADLQQQSGQSERAEDTLNEGLRLSPNQLELVMALARLKVTRSNLPAAVEVLQRYQPSGQEPGEFHAMAGAIQLKAGQHQAAAVAYRQALARNPDQGDWWVGLGMALKEANQPAAAKDAFSRAAHAPELSPKLASYVAKQLGETARP
ncbi:tetratricopeptide repeat protein [Chitinimonas sp. PSY-7]|uniref:tetratricopeptide repeat protein n=1 Tax=Chitinimonas sp. PSY-7 TaxID=3459088 RepID=UPI004040160D